MQCNNLHANDRKAYRKAQLGLVAARQTFQSVQQMACQPQSRLNLLDQASSQAAHSSVHLLSQALDALLSCSRPCLSLWALLRAPYEMYEQSVQ